MISNNSNNLNQVLPWHKDIISYIEKAQDQNKLPHAIMIRERDGFYEDKLINNIANMILCDNQSVKCECKHCKLLQNETHPNLIYLNAKDKVSIDDIRKLESNLWKTSLFEKPKIAVIRFLDLISIGAKNSLLKTLEEPPKNVFFIISFENKAYIPATIASRVQHLHHKTPSQSEIVNWLVHKAEKEKTITTPEAIIIAKLVNYNPAKSIDLILSETKVDEINQEKKLFARFILNKYPAFLFAKRIDKNNSEELSRRYKTYTETIIQNLFKTSANDFGKDDYNLLNYQSWKGVTQKQLFFLCDCLQEIINLSKTNVNIELQAKNILTIWQNESYK